MGEDWLCVCKNEKCGHEWDAPTQPPKPGTRCPECLGWGIYALRPQDRGRSPKARTAAAEAEAKAKVEAAEAEAKRTAIEESFREPSAPPPDA